MKIARKDFGNSSYVATHEGCCYSPVPLTDYCRNAQNTLDWLKSVILSGYWGRPFYLATITGDHYNNVYCHYFTFNGSDEPISYFLITLEWINVHNIMYNVYYHWLLGS